MDFKQLTFQKLLLILLEEKSSISSIINKFDKKWN